MLHAALLSLSLALFPPATLDDLGFMAGAWRAELGPMVVEETWLPPRAGNMTGVFRMSGPDGVELLELMSIEQTEAGLTFRLRHFDEALVPWASEIDGPLVANASVPEPGVVVFTPIEPDAGFESITYRRAGESLTATVVFAEDSGQDPFQMVFEPAG